ncbi:hypothetical protein [Candidatus Berkiella aquae]|uniref:Uncharacterized protein n=2 Tax=Candidatus Berkiella aquae TaxID=295108 RepID=A0AAE3HSS6_9GAMM|nr:hypothetical protein [Candidatus Berkiella aquae]MCS5709972.1 hypothetical protein [Candidatus Berkiella aquae]
MDIQYMDNCTTALPDDCWTECSQCQQRFLVKYWDEELDWYIEVNLSKECSGCQQRKED